LTAESDQPLDYPFHLVLTSATIPLALASYLDKHHPTLTRLASPNLHHLPKALQTEYVNWTGGNKFADIERRIRKVWAEDFSSTTAQPGVVSPLSKVLVFCNKSTKVNDLGAHLQQKGIKNIALTSTSDQRKRGSNRHLEGFLREHNKGHEEKENSEHAPKPVRQIPQPVGSSPTSVLPESRTDPKEEPHVMITTSLLSRGLDFSPSIRHVFIVDEPRNMIDFLHRAGRAGRAGQWGKVVVFGKMKGRGSAKAKDVRKRVGALLA
jgi:ATP-dependent RNA helicase MRH4